ncbi:alkylphosphonate utilization protein [Puniceibacterium confluentis]|uniref:alkylphosphonate utilization protein n=1 Tax=Puniceibacterium confluentis TaxID=1958944 RepID=UPI001648FF2A|nr:alkylphosphonate utilization protein [Puniceibacterium confluentis]
MTAPLSLRLTGASVLRDGKMVNRSVAIEDGRITKGPLPEVDLRGYFILPGIIDLHGADFLRHVISGQSHSTALRATDQAAAANGVTTAWLSQNWSWAEQGPHSPAAAEALMSALAAYRAQALSDLRIQIACETHTVDSADRLLEAVRRFQVDQVVFRNSLPQALLHPDPRPDERARLHRAEAQKSAVPRYLCRLAEAFDTLGVTYGSFEDPDGETRETFSMIGAKVCTCPTRRAAAALARAVGDPVLLRASGVTSPGPALPVTDLIRARLCDALVSDLSYPALSAAAFQLAIRGVMPLPAAWALISQRPAEILRLHDRGVIDYGRRADLAIVSRATRQVEATLCGGRISHLSGLAATRFLGARADMAMAAE